MATFNITLSGERSVSTGGNSGYRIMGGTASHKATGSFTTPATGMIEITSIVIPWFVYSSTNSDYTASGTLKVTIDGQTLTGTLPNTSVKHNTNTTGSTTCTGSIRLIGSTSYTIEITAEGSNFLKTGVNMVSNGTTVTATYTDLGSIRVNVNGTWKQGVVYINVNGAWKQGIPYVNINGTWKLGI